MATHGTIGEFRNAQESWQSYVERLQQYFIANDVKTADKQWAVLLSAVGGQTYQLIRNLLAPTKPTEVTFAEIVDAVQKHVQPRPSLNVERFNFHTRTRRHGEDISTYVAELRKLSEHCKFGARFGATLNDMLRDRLVCGIADQRIQRRLLAEPDLTFAKALEIAQAAEAAERNTQELVKGTQPPRVHTLNTGPSERPRKEGGAQFPNCYRCGGKHKPEQCKFKESACNYLGKKGHLAKVYRSKLRRGDDQKKSDRKKPLQTYHVEVQADETDRYVDKTTYKLFAVTGEPSTAPPLMVQVMANQAPLKMEVDTGPSVSLISKETFTKLWPDEQGRPELQQSASRLRTYTGQELEVQGSVTVKVTYGSQQETLALLIVAGDGPSILGRDWLQKLRLDWRALNHLRTALLSELQAILNQHKDVFKDELGCVRSHS